MPPTKKPKTIAEAQQAIERLDEKQAALEAKKDELNRILQELVEEEEKREAARKAQLRVEIVDAIMEAVGSTDLDDFNTHNKERVVKVLAELNTKQPDFFNPQPTQEQPEDEQPESEYAGDSEDSTYYPTDAPQ